MRRVGLEKWVHERISSDNDTFFAAINAGLQFHRDRKAQGRLTPPSAVPDADAITQAALTLGAATLGESGAAPDAPAGEAGVGGRAPGRARRIRCAAPAATTSPSTSRWRARRPAS